MNAINSQVSTRNSIVVFPASLPDIQTSQAFSLNPEVLATIRKIKKVVARSPRAKMIIKGETGTGKDVATRNIIVPEFRRVHGVKSPYVTVNCGAIPENLVNSELFGHKKGAFTGADADRVGRFEQANGGVLFLDEIGELPLDVQATVLRALESGEIQRVGDSRTLQSSFMLVAATHRNLEEMVREGTFREDLYYRLNVFPFELPALRERAEDIPYLTQIFLKTHGGDRAVRISPQAMQKLERYSWPGNARELSNVVERACVLSDNEILQSDDFELSDLKLEMPNEGTHVASPPINEDIDTIDLLINEFANGLTIDELKKVVVRKLLEERGPEETKTAIAEKSGLSRSSFYRIAKVIQNEDSGIERGITLQ